MDKFFGEGIMFKCKVHIAVLEMVLDACKLPILESMAAEFTNGHCLPVVFRHPDVGGPGGHGPPTFLPKYHKKKC